jgi:hypothetical protein
MNNLVEIESVEQVTEAEEVKKKKNREGGRERERESLISCTLLTL